MKRSLFFVLCPMTVQKSLSQYSIDNPSLTQCLAAPCIYEGECRSGSDSNECGEGISYCNESSIWVPACGGGGTLQKEPALTETATAQADSQIDLGLTQDTNEEPSPAPTTAWEAWTNSKNNGGSSGTNQGVIGYTTGKEGEDPDWKPSEEAGWFDKQGWESGNRTNDEDESIFSKYNPFSRNDENSARSMNRVDILSLTAGACLIAAVLDAV